MRTAGNALLLSRRDLLKGLGAGLALSLFGPRALRAAGAETPLLLHGPPAGPSVLLAEAVRAAPSRWAFKVWRSPDEMRAGLASGSMQAVVLPIQVAANLYNRGFPLRLLNVLTDGLLYIISADATLTSITALAGRRIAVPFRNDMPDLVLARLLAHAGMEPGRDLELHSSGTPVEAMQLLLMGRVDAAVVAEPAATAAINQGRRRGLEIRRVIDMQEAWAAATGKAPVLPQAGLALTNALLDARPALAGELQAALAAAAGAVNAAPAAAAEQAAPLLDFPAPVLAESIAFSRLVATPAAQARAPIETMLETLAAGDPETIGGHLPEADFYLPGPPAAS